MAKRLVCPNKCADETFTVTAHVTETWKVDSSGEFCDTVETGDEQVVHRPSIEEGDLFSCSTCGTEAKIEEVPDGEG